jgi:hypothetical protein
MTSRFTDTGPGHGAGNQPGLARRSYNMAPDPRITRVAEILIDKHGRRAASVAQKRAKDRIDKRDYTTALVWVQVLEAASDLLQIPHSLTR